MSSKHFGECTNKKIEWKFIIGTLEIDRFIETSDLEDDL